MIHAQQRSEACAIWFAGLAAVRSESLIARHLQHSDSGWSIQGTSLEPESDGRVVVVGAGKAVAGMAAGWERTVGRATLARWRSSGWIQVPSNCVRPLQTIHVHCARPHYANEPSLAGVWGSLQLQQRVASLTARDVCVCLLSGGGSALLPALREPLQLDDLLTMTRALSSAGATIQQINAVRKRVCVLLGGGLARACRAGRLITLVLSDILGDPLDLISSAPTWCADDEQAEARAGLDVWNQFADRVPPLLAARVRQLLMNDLQPLHSSPPPTTLATSRSYVVLGNNESAVTAAAAAARQRAFDTTIIPTHAPTMQAEAVGRALAGALCDAQQRADQSGRPVCLISGGEPVVTLVDSTHRGLGGRNQHLALAALHELQKRLGASCVDVERLTLVSAGTDGEDGPTDAAGAIVDASVFASMRHQQLDPCDYLARNDSYHFFAATQGLWKTGPTHTNVCDLRVLIAWPRESFEASNLFDG